MRVPFLPWGFTALFMWAAASPASTIDLYFDPGFGSTAHTGCTAIVSLSFSEEAGEEWLAVAIHNTTPTSIGSRLTALGLELPDSLSLDVAFAPGGQSDYFDTLTFDVSICPWWLNAPGGYDLMITSDGKFEGGNPRGAPAAGQTHTVTLTLGDTGLTPGQLLTTFQDYYVRSDDHIAVARFQSVGPNGELSDKVGGGVPGPASISLLALGGLTVLRRKSAC